MTSIFKSVGRNVVSIWNPSRGPTSTIWIWACGTVATSPLSLRLPPACYFRLLMSNFCLHSETGGDSYMISRVERHESIDCTPGKSDYRFHPGQTQPASSSCADTGENQTCAFAGTVAPRRYSSVDPRR